MHIATAALSISGRKLTIYTLATLAAMHVASAALAQAAGLARERFILSRDGHELRLPYETSHPLTREHEDVRHLVVMIHGVLRDVDRYHRFMESLRRNQRDEGLAILTPQFIAQEEVDEHGLDGRYPYWARGGWSAGHRSRSDDLHPRAVRISSYEMLDELLMEAASSFPNLERITLAGHSAGGQFINRYAAANALEPALNERGIALHYIISNPSSYLYFCDHRLICRETRVFAPLEADNCARVNTYRYGLGADVNAYMRAAGIEQIPETYASRRITYLLGEADNNPEANRLDRSCAALAQGEHRLERGQIYIEYLEFRFGSEILDRHTVVLVPGIGHSAARMYGSDRGRAVLFGAAE